MTPTTIILLLVLATTVSASSIPFIPCLDDCFCEQDDRNPIVRCENGDRTELKLPRQPMDGYEIIALPCNDIVNLPSVEILSVAFPSLKSIDVEGNVRFNCSQLSALGQKYAVNSDCGKDEPFQCSSITADCDWKCRTLEKLREMWRQFKETVSRKAQDWGAEESFEKVQNWFSRTYTKIARNFEN